MSMDYIRNYYKVHAKRGMKVIANDSTGVIIGVRGAHLIIHLEGEKNSRIYHPTWEI